MSYDKTFTDALEFAWGMGFLSPGGPEEVRTLLGQHDISGKAVLDIGAGLGGVDLLLVKEHGAARVTGIDVDSRLVAQASALSRREGLAGRITFQAVEPGPLPFAGESFDVVFSKDAMIHIQDKAALYAEVLRVLKPGGHFIASDWLFAEGAAADPAIRAWLADHPLRFVLTTTTEAREALERAGFADPRVIDRRRFLEDLNRREVAMLEGAGRQKLAAIVGEKMALDRLASARGRQKALESGKFIPAHLGGRKPLG